MAAFSKSCFKIHAMFAYIVELNRFKMHAIFVFVFVFLFINPKGGRRFCF